MSQGQKPVVEHADNSPVGDLKNSFQNAFKNTGADENAQIPPSKYRHPKESAYFTIAAVTGGFVWLLLLFAVLSMPVLLLSLIPVGVLLFITLRVMKAAFFGNAVNINERQCPEIYAEVKKIAQQLGIKQVPYIFVANGEGGINALAIRLVGKGYVVLFGELVDHYLDGGHEKELQFVVTHELAHHAAGHTAMWKSLLTGPASWIPFLGKAYGRACEYTCDRAGALAVNDADAAENAILSLAHGSNSLKSKLNVDAFLEQEKQIPGFFAFLLEINYTHPRLTRRVQGVRAFCKK